jgi:hypothetical protein
LLPSSFMSHSSAVGVATGYRLDHMNPGRVTNVHFSVSSRPSLGPLAPYQWVPRAFSPGVKRQGREADHSPPTNAEVKKTWIYTSTPPYVFMA